MQQNCHRNGALCNHSVFTKADSRSPLNSFIFNSSIPRSSINMPPKLATPLRIANLAATTKAASSPAKNDSARCIVKSETAKKPILGPATFGSSSQTRPKFLTPERKKQKGKATPVAIETDIEFDAVREAIL